MLDFLYQTHIPKLRYEKDDNAELEQLKLMAVAVREKQENEPEDEVKAADQIETGEIIEVKEERAQDKAEFRNVPEALIEIIENAPSIKQLDEDEEEDAAMVARLEQDASQIEALVFGGDKEGCIKKRARLPADLELPLEED